MLSIEMLKKYLDLCCQGLHEDVADRIHKFVELRGRPFELLEKLEKVDELRNAPGAEVRAFRILIRRNIHFR